MARSRRPELEKDNPVAPQPYVGPRRRQARAHKSGSTSAAAQSETNKILQTLMEAAERFVNGAPRSKKLEAERNALLDAITQAQWLLSVEQLPAKRPDARRARHH
jgi:hypothetical protein